MIKMRKEVIKFALPLFFFSFWAIMSLKGFKPSLFNVLLVLVHPTKDIFGIGSLVTCMVVSLKEIGIGYSVAAFAGVSLGILFYYKTFDDFFGSTINTLRHIPDIAWIPLLLVWAGIGIKSIVTVIFLESFFPYRDKYGVRSKEYTTALDRIRQVFRC